MSKYEWYDDPATGGRTIVIMLDKADIASAKLTKFDLMLFDDINNDNPSSTPLADQLIGLETLVRRIEEARKPKAYKVQIATLTQQDSGKDEVAE